ncbi:hypothetical protein OBBRIDRAFT_881275 [Obba rivulosa]|uniref:Lethal giant larvae (Lgl)-like C-terminal domain-containing protein n=1 Tax=Obba rivulosa TaxID=1052685 RepID=A0A8E2ARB7_9APHY|nr:hypothetical protein OBBRIDRAFT_881275 [Obba rivulosa]
MFSFKNEKDYVDLSLELSDETDWRVETLRTFNHHLDITALAVDSISGLFAVGTSKGNIYLYGSPGVECRLSITDPPGTKVRLLQFAISAFKLLCVDDHDRMHIWDLAAAGKPRLQKIVNFPHPVNCITASPAHTHAFVALSNGEIKTYDLLCLRTSSYVIPNLWTAYEEKRMACGSPLPSVPGSSIIVDIFEHPRALDILFVTHAGGVVLYDLKQRCASRTFELVNPPGAPGGAGFHAPDILTHRRPAVTAVAIHPSGHVLCVGYADGSLAFWALDDEDRPLLVRTLDSVDDEDVNTVDTSRLEIAQANPHGANFPPREPIFKLTWSGFPNSSDPRGGETVLTVLGGLLHGYASGITALLFPALAPPAPPPPSPRSSAQAIAQHPLHPKMRSAMRASLLPHDVYTYPTLGVPQDFLLIPHSSPHFGGAWDPQAILLLSDSGMDSFGETRSVEACEFPPPSFGVSGAQAAHPALKPLGQEANAEGEDPQTVLDQDLAETLQLLSLSRDPGLLGLPFSLSGVLGSTLVRVDKGAYEILVRDEREGAVDAMLPVKGGIAWVEDPEGQMKLMRYQPHRLLITYHPDYTVRFQDLSPQLLISKSPDAPLQSAFPALLPALTIELTPLLIDPLLGLVQSTDSSSTTSKTKADEPEGDPTIAYVKFAVESHECVTVLSNGAVVLHRLGSANVTSGYIPEPKKLFDEELIHLQHLRVRSGLRFQPFLGIKPGNGHVSACAISDIGFLAVAYSSGTLLIIDLRGPKVILRRSHSEKSVLHRHGERDPIVSLSWTVCGLSSEPAPSIRLLGTVASGATTLYTIVRSGDGAWNVSASPHSLEAAQRPLPGGSVVLDAKTGARVLASRSGLAAALRAGQHDAAENDLREAHRHTLWVSTGAKGARCVADLTGERIAKADWSNKAGAVLQTEVIERNGGSVLVAFTEHQEALVYSLPFLELLLTLQLPPSFALPFTTDDSGDIVSHTLHPSGLARFTYLYTLFGTRRTSPYAAPVIDLTYGRGTIPPHPQPVSLTPTSVISSWLGYLAGQGAMTGDQVDTLLAGPDRPVPPPTAAQRPIARPAPAQAMSEGTSSLTATAGSMSSGVGDLYNRLGNALAERGQMLGDLQESFDSLEQGSKKMVSQAKNLAAQQSAKRWFNF